MQVYGVIWQNEELPLENVHREFKEKMFIAQLKLGNTKDGSGNDHYTIAYYFEENAATSSFNKDSRSVLRINFSKLKNRTQKLVLQVLFL